MHLTESDLLFLARFAKLPEGKTLLEMFEKKLDETNRKLRVTDGTEVHRQQGRALELDEWIVAIRGAGSKLASGSPPFRSRRPVVNGENAY